MCQLRVIDVVEEFCDKKMHSEYCCHRKDMGFGFL